MHRVSQYKFVVLLALFVGFSSPVFAGEEANIATCLIQKINEPLLTHHFDDKQRKDFESASREVKSKRRKLQRIGFNEAALNEDVIKNHNTHYTKVIDDSAIADQMRTGDCWDFAGCRTVSDDLYKKGVVGKKFQISKNFIFFYSTLEKADKILVSDVAQLLQTKLPDENIDKALNVTGIVNDGGYYEYFNFLANKYGIVPASAMKSTASFRDSSAMDQELTDKLAAIAAKMKEKYKSFQFADDQKLLTESQADELLKIRAQGMEDVYTLVASHLGVPPKKFTFTFKDGTKKEFTPKQFAEEVVKFNPKRNIVISSDPTLPFDKGYVIPGSQLSVQKPSEPSSANHFLNVKNDRLLELVKEAIDQGHAVWFGADANQSMVAISKSNGKAAGIMHPQIYKTDQIYGYKDKDAFPNLNDEKAELVAGTTAMDHAMVIVGYDLDENGKIVKLKVANSWGKKVGTHGYFHMYREWFEKYVSQIAIPEQILNKSEKEILKQPKTALPGS